MHGLAARLQLEVAQTFGSGVKVVVPPDVDKQQYSAWIGASMLMSSPSHKFAMQHPLWIHKENYDDSGPAVVHQHSHVFSLPK